MIRLLIVHEVRLIADLTASALRMDADIEVVACVHTAEAALALLRKTQCDVLLVSVTLPQEGAASLTRAAANMPNAGKVVVTGVVEAQTMILHWLEAGAADYIHPDEAVATLVQKVRRVAQGECLVSPALAAILIAHIHKLKQQIGELYGLRALNPDALYAELTERECEVLDLIEQRYSNQRIGNALYIELGTVKNHVHNILDKLGVRTRQQAAILARQAVASAVTGKPVEQRELGYGQTHFNSSGQIRIYRKAIDVSPTNAAMAT